MKKIITALALIGLTTTPALADGYRGHHGGYHGGYGHYGNHYHGNDWIAPAIIGGIVGYAIAQPRTVYVQPQPQVIYQPQVYSTIPPGGYHYETILDAYCNCYRTVLVQN
jgi:hypothetical protein